MEIRSVLSAQCSVLSAQDEACLKPVKQKNSGFTLVELSIVLVIIGLLVGGILAGADLIRIARLNSIREEVEKFKMATNVFYGKYNCLPGDCYNITTYLSGVTNGNGNEYIAAWDTGAGGTIGGSGAEENFYAWQQLAVAGLIPGVYSGIDPTGAVCNTSTNNGCPKSRSGKNVAYWMVSTGFYSTPVEVTIVMSKDTDGNWSAPIPAKDASWIDTKYDDGLPNKGHILSFGYGGYQGATINYSGGGWTSNCVTGTAPSLTYTSSSDPTCKMVFIHK